MHLPIHEFKPMSSVFLGKCVNHEANLCQIFIREDGKIALVKTLQICKEYLTCQGKRRGYRH